MRRMGELLCRWVDTRVQCFAFFRGGGYRSQYARLDLYDELVFPILITSILIGFIRPVSTNCVCICGHSKSRNKLVPPR
jgi:hypothetical protein